MKHLKKFQTQSQCETYMNGSNYVEPFVGFVAETREISYNKHDYSQDYLTFNITSPGTINISLNDGELFYSKNDGNWISVENEETQINVIYGDVVKFKGDNASCPFSESTAGFEVEGNIMSLINSTGFTTATTLTSEYAFSYLFDGCTGLTTAEHLVLPATTLAEGCYASMFAYCSSLTTAPELPATTLADGCYDSMFGNCTGLTSAPELPATTLADGCYNGMFKSCYSLTTAPELPATTLADGCYFGIFYDCTSLNYIKCLATNISASYCTGDWVDSVASSGTFIKNPNMSSWTRGTSGIPTGWTVQDA